MLFKDALRSLIGKDVNFEDFGHFGKQLNFLYGSSNRRLIAVEDDFLVLDYFEGYYTPKVLSSPLEYIPFTSIHVGIFKSPSVDGSMRQINTKWQK